MTMQPLMPPVPALTDAMRLLTEWLLRLDQREDARTFLQMLPYVLDDDPERRRLMRLVENELAHCRTPEAYATAYDSIWEADAPVSREHVMATGMATPRFQMTLALCRRLGATTVLDLGAGNGGLVLFLAVHGIAAHGINLTSRCIAPAQAIAERLQIPATFSFGHSEEVEHPADVVAALEIIEHVRDPKALIAAMDRNAKLACILSTPDGSTTHGLDTWREWGRTLETTDVSPCIAHIRVYTAERLTAFLASCGHPAATIGRGADGLQELLAMWQP